MISICTSSVVIVSIRRDLPFYFAKEYAGKAKHPIDGVGDLKYMIRSLKAYNAYVRRKLSGRFDEYLVLSKIIASAHDHKKYSNESFLNSFTTPNELGPLICLARIMEVEKNQTILVAEGISDKLKDLTPLFFRSAVWLWLLLVS